MTLPDERRNAFDRIIVEAMSWQPSENGPSYDQTYKELIARAHHLLAPPTEWEAHVKSHQQQVANLLTEIDRLNAANHLPDLPQEAQAWCQPMDKGEHTPRKFLLYFEDADRGIAVFDNEDEARTAFEKANTAWNCYLFGALALSRPNREPSDG